MIGVCCLLVVCVMCVVRCWSVCAAWCLLLVVWSLAFGVWCGACCASVGLFGLLLVDDSLFLVACCKLRVACGICLLLVVCRLLFVGCSLLVACCWLCVVCCLLFND